MKTIDINGQKCVNGHIIVKFKRDPNNKIAEDVAVNRQMLIEKYKATVKKQWRIGAELWNIDTLQMPDATKHILDSLKRLDYIKYAEPDFMMSADTIPNDPYYDSLWGLKQIHAPMAWNNSTGDTTLIVGIIDTGIDYNHIDLLPNIWINPDEIPNNGIDDDNNGYIDDIHGWDFFNNDNDPMDDHGHGTHIAGIIGASGNNSIGIVGVNWNVKMVALKFLSATGSGNTSDEISAIEYAIEENIRITNNSYGRECCDCFSQAEYDVIQLASDSNMVFCAAAGNKAHTNDIDLSFQHPSYPASNDLDNIISVASSGYCDLLSNFSNYGELSVDLSAPGEQIFSTVPGNSYALKSGTSMATAFVTGAIANIWKLHPQLSNIEIKERLLETVDIIPSNEELLFSKGRLNVYGASGGLIHNPYELNFRAELTNQLSPYDTLFLTNTSDLLCTIDSISAPEGFLISTDTNTASFTNFLTGIQITANEIDTMYLRFLPDSAGTYYKSIKSRFYYDPNKVYYQTSIIKGRGIANGTIVQEGEVTGVWDSSHSPYYINGDIKVTNNNTLLIGPGVNIEYQGHYRCTIRDGKLCAKGTNTDTIKWYPYDSQIGWYGLRFINSSNDDTLQFCQISESKKKEGFAYTGQGPEEDYYGGGIFSVGSNPTINHCIFYKNRASYGGAIYFTNNQSSIRFCHNMIINNYAKQGFGGIQFSFGNSLGFTLNNNLVANNFANLNAGGLYIHYEGPDSCFIISNNTFVNNKINYFFGSAFYCQTGQPVFRNNIIYGNEDPNNSQIYLAESQNLNNAKNNLIQGGYPGIGNIDVNPLFVNPSNGTGIHYDALHSIWQVKDSSKCINNGIADTTGLDLDSNDLNLNTRIFANVIDIGAFENQNNLKLLTSVPPDLLDFGATTIGDSVIQNIILFSGTIPIEIDSIVIVQDSMNDFSINNSQLSYLPASHKDTVQIKYKPSNLANDTASIYFYSDAINNQKIKIKLQGIGIVGEIISGGAVSGNWYKQNNNYNILNNIYIPEGQSLRIHPGVKVLFHGPFMFEIKQNSSLIAYGEQGDSVVFMPSDTIIGWKGIKLTNTENEDTLSFCIISHSKERGLTIKNSSPNISNCKISNNYVYGNGGGIYLQNSGSMMKENTICNNIACGDGGGIHGIECCGNLTLINNTIMFNKSLNCAGGMSLYDSHVKISGNCFSNNYSLFHAGGILLLRSNARVENNLVINNQTPEIGGGLKVESSNPLLISNTFANNKSGIAKGGGIGIVGGNLNLKNNILWGNSDTQIKDLYYPVNLTVNYCNIQQDSIPGLTANSVGNINIDPLFINPSSGTGISYSGVNADWHLFSNSPCINAGTPDTTGFNLPLVDLDGNVRIWFDTIDMGTYEYGAPPYIPPVPTYSLSGVFSYNNIANTAIDSLWVFRKQNGIKLDSVRTSVSGDYNFQQVPNGLYTISAETDKQWGGVNGTDALKIMRHFAGLEDLTIPVRKTSADVNNTQNINATDAVKVQLRCVGIDSTFERGDWTFEKHGGGDTVVIAGANQTVNFYGLCVGDVNGSNIPGSGAKSADDPELKVDNVIKAGSGTELFLPVSVTSDCELGAVTLELAYPEDLIEIEGISLSQINPYFTAKTGTFKAVWSDLHPVKAFADQPYAFIKIRTKEKFITGSIVQFRIAGKMTELSDPRGEPISDLAISIPTIKYDEKPDHQYLYIYPNPAKSKTHVIYNARETGKIKLTMYDISMHRVREYDLHSANKGLNEFDLDVSNFATGEYLLELRFNGKTYKEKQVEKLLIGTRE